MYRVHGDPRFLELLKGFDLRKLEGHPNTVFGLGSDLTLGYFNAAWLQFAMDNGGEPIISRRWKIGASVIDGIIGPLKSYYAAGYAQCLAKRTRWDHTYECSSPEFFRQFHMTAYPLVGGGGLLVLNSLVVEAPHDPLTHMPRDPDTSIHCDENELIHQCSHCRRVQRMDTPDQWDWVPAWVAHSPRNASHGLCQVCMAYYYPEITD